MSILITLIIFVSFWGEATFGFGGGLIAIPLLGTVIGVKDAVTLVLIFQLLMGLLILGSYRDVHWKNFIFIAPSLAVGSVIGTYSLAFTDESVLRMVLAAFIVMYLVKSTCFSKSTIPRIATKSGAILVNSLAGWIEGIIGTAGPVFVLYLSELKLEKRNFRATIILYLFFSNILRIPVSVQKHLLTTNLLTEALWILPLFLIALLLGHFMHKKFSEEVYRYAINTVLLISVVSLLR